MGKTTKLQRAKRQTRKKFQKTLRDLPKLSKDGFQFGGGGCAFCSEYSLKTTTSARYCFPCPIRKQCAEYRKRNHVVLDKRYWRALAAELCRWVLREIDKIKEPTT